MLRPLEHTAVGQGQHRSGWPYCLDALRPLFTPTAPVTFDDFIERTFLYNKTDTTATHLRPWIGVLHHPPDMPAWYLPKIHLQQLATNSRWQQALPQLKLIITLGENLQTWCQSQWPTIPCVVIKHPTAPGLLQWSSTCFLQDQHPTVVQIGWFLRNLQAIHQAQVPAGFRKVQLTQAHQLELQLRQPCAVAYKRANAGTVELISGYDDTAYDLLLAKSVVLLEVMSAVANNTVVECISRHTPLCINRHPGPVAYLGENYPLFYDRFEEISQVLTAENILDAHQYLTRMDKWWLSGTMFREQVRAACLTHVPECWSARQMDREKR